MCARRKPPHMGWPGPCRKSRQDRRIPGADMEQECETLNRRSSFLWLSGRVLEIFAGSTGRGAVKENIAMNPRPSCHLQFVGATVGLLKAVVRVAVRKPTRAQGSLVPAARR